jgi:hypothetical protein
MNTLRMEEKQSYSTHFVAKKLDENDHGRGIFVGKNYRRRSRKEYKGQIMKKFTSNKHVETNRLAGKRVYCRAATNQSLWIDHQ